MQPVYLCVPQKGGIRTGFLTSLLAANALRGVFWRAA